MSKRPFERIVPPPPRLTKRNCTFCYFHDHLTETAQLLNFFPGLCTRSETFEIKPESIDDESIAASIDKLGDGVVHFFGLLQTRSGSSERPFYFLAYEYFRAFLCNPSYSLHGSKHIVVVKPTVF